MTGDLLELEVRENETYRSLYILIQEALPEEIRPESLSQMNLLLDGELVSISHAPVSVEDVGREYQLLLDDTSYHVVAKVDGIWGTQEELIINVTMEPTKAGAPAYSKNIIFNTVDRVYYTVGALGRAGPFSAALIGHIVLGGFADAVSPSYAVLRDVTTSLDFNLQMLEEENPKP